ncbi:hypothetical protein [Actinocatenispora rupis]|uniref:Uncharacterized protein n=1 Tax=Actinocatenispora rupis TaxID=519421 RepID=A0A8J3NC16_9ACTN|nr:hypothetical protein [Actinocatenispora rupis]GID13626.1 hypothetical protein Aru02nite_45150 [Actinocatenispora rupis]
MYPQANPANPLHQERWLPVETLEQNAQALDDYPHKYVFVVTRSNGEMTTSFGRGQLVAARLFWAVEMLETKGWEPAAWDLDGESVGVVMRRVGGGGTSYELDSGQWS